MSSKKLVVGYSFKPAKMTRTSPWAQRGRVTAEALQLTFLLSHNAHLKLPVILRRRLPKTDLEERLEICCLALSLRDELMQSVPNIEDALAEKI
jgi:hypothetical protein